MLGPFQWLKHIWYCHNTGGLLDVICTQSASFRVSYHWHWFCPAGIKQAARYYRGRRCSASSSHIPQSHTATSPKTLHRCIRGACWFPYYVKISLAYTIPYITILLLSILCMIRQKHPIESLNFLLAFSTEHV